MANPQSVNAGNIQINYGLASQDVNANTSLLNWNLQLVDAAVHGSSSYYNWSFNPGNLSGSGGWIYATNNTVIASGQITIYHDSYGNGSVSMAGYFDWYNGSGTATATYTAPSTARTPTVATTSTSNLESSQFAVSSNITWGGNNPVSSRGFCYNTTGTPTISDSKVTSGSGTGAFSSTISNLDAGTTYYVRAYATNGVSTSYGSQTAVTTTSNGFLPILGALI